NRLLQVLVGFLSRLRLERTGCTRFTALDVVPQRSSSAHLCADRITELTRCRCLVAQLRKLRQMLLQGVICVHLRAPSGLVHPQGEPTLAIRERTTNQRASTVTLNCA